MAGRGSYVQIRRERRFWMRSEADELDELGRLEIDTNAAVMGSLWWQLLYGVINNFFVTK